MNASLKKILDKNSLKAGLKEQLDLFCFFHLGSDASLELREEEDRLRITVDHHRVEPFEFTISYGELEILLTTDKGLEDFLLDEIIPHRR